MTDKKWFILFEGQVRGPYLAAEIETQAPQLSYPLIWGRGQSEWLPPTRWLKSLNDLNETALKNNSHTDRLWRIREGAFENKPMSYDQMVTHLKTKPDLSEVMLWTEGYSDWKEIYQIHKIMDDLGVSRRAHPRVPIMGTLQCEGASGPFTARLLSISEGGLGITETPTLKIGEKLKILIKSPNLFGPIQSTAEVVYIGHDGYAGLKFSALQTESKSTIIEYVKKFIEVRPSSVEG